jgi:hypothetical protein
VGKQEECWKRAEFQQRKVSIIASG